jgi:hypothetical protein
MTAQRTPDELSSENALICEKLLNWNRCTDRECTAWIITGDGEHWYSTPSFTTWLEAGLLLDSLARVSCEWDIHTSAVDGFSAQVDIWPGSVKISTDWFDTAPLAIRAAALAYIRSLP